LSREAGKHAARDQGHDDKGENFERVTARVVPQFADEVLEFVDEAGDEAVARAAFVIRGAGAAVVGVARGGAVGAGVGGSMARGGRR